jgi:hypothetical protein
MKQQSSVGLSRRRLLTMAGASAGATVLTPYALLAEGVRSPSTAAKPDPLAGNNTSFAPLKQIDAGVLSVGYAEAGPANGPPVILLHGWPYDIYSYVDVAPILASAGYRVIDVDHL